MAVGESQENLVRKDTMQSQQSVQVPSEVALTAVEKKFLLFVERGDCASVRRQLEENRDSPEFDINCVDPLNRSALIAAIENENVELIHILLDAGIRVKDSLLHAIKEEYVEAVELLLEFEEKTHKPGTPYSWEAVDRAQSTFTPDITPLMLAAHMNNYEIIKILLDRGATLPTPHDVRCGCDDCIESSEKDSLRHSQARINAYRALSSPSLIALSSRDPLLTAFELSWELRRLSKMENEFREEYNEMREQVQTFAKSLLDHARTSAELDTMLNHNPDGDHNWEPGERSTLERLKLAIKYKQKNFVAHPNVQQLLGKIWYDGLPGFRRKSMVQQMFEVGKLGAMFPIYSTIYMLAPKSKMATFMSKPFVKFICHSSSYAFFLLLLGAASQRVEFLLIEWFGNEWLQEILADWKRRERGSLPGIVESGVIIYVFSLISWEMRCLWSDGLLEYISDLWNIVDFISNIFYTTWIILRCTSIFISWREYWSGWDPYYPREKWDPFDPMLLSEGMFAAGMILSFLKLVHIFSVNPHLGPLQISLGRMIIDIVKFFFIYTLVLFAFGCGMNQLMWYYADLEKRKCYHLPSGEADFDKEDKACTIWRRFANMFETSQSLFWASFGLVDLIAFELQGIKSFTRFWALLMFGSYSVINVIVLLNMLIAMMSNSYQIISERSDVEWKFARSKLWMSYFDDGDVVPPPFNLLPSVNMFLSSGDNKKTNSVRVRSRDKAIERHDIVMRLLVRRFVTAEQCKRDDEGITEDDVMEVRQDISTLRYEIVDILKNNGMKTPNLNPSDSGIHGKKGKTMERRLLKDFQIGFVEGVVNEALTTEKESKDVFSKIARAIGNKRSSTQKKDWNADAKRRASRRNLIGSTSEINERRSTRQSLRRHIIENQKAGMTNLDTNKLVAYNPKLRDVSPAARVAYAKFKLRKIQEEYQQNEEEIEDDVFEDKPLPRMTRAKTTAPSSRPRPASASFTAALKSVKSVSSTIDVVLQMEPDSAVPPPKQTAPPPTTKLQQKKSPSPQPKVDVSKSPSAGKLDEAKSPEPVKSADIKTTDNKSESSESAINSKPTTPPTRVVSPEPPQPGKGPSNGISSNKQPVTPTSADLKPASSSPTPAKDTPPVPQKPAPKAETKKDEKPTPQSDPKPVEAKAQYSSDLEPGRGKSKVTGRMVQGWI